MNLSSIFKTVGLLVLLVAPGYVTAATRAVTSTSDNPVTVGTLPYWLLNADDGDIIDCSSIAGQTITLTSSLPAITKSYTINGAGITIDGAGSYQAFQVASGTVGISNVTVQNALSKGGDGGDGYSGGGGAVGGGGALYVHGGTSVTLTASSLLNNAAQGGNGGAANNNGNAGAGGGGGFGGGSGGSALATVSTGGGGGGHSNGGNGGSDSSVNGSNGIYFGGGGGGAGINSIAPGGNGGNASPTGAFAGGTQSNGNGGGGAGGSADGFSATGTGISGVPGNGGNGIGADLLFGGGGGGGSASETGSPGGAGVGAAGGGGGSNYSGGDGGILGGGGAGGLGGAGGVGGFGAGGGGAVTGGIGGGGFSAGGGAGGSDPSAANGGGGGGSGLGGAIFVQADGNLVVVDASQISGNTAIAGVGGSSTNSSDPGYIAPGNGAAMGNDIFVREHGSVVFDVSGTLTIATPIEGDHTSGPGGSGGLQKLGAGTLNLGGANTYSGTTTVDGGTLILNGSVIGDVAIGAAGTLSGNATVAGSLTTSGAVLASINSGGTSKVAVGGAATLAGTLKITLAPNATSGTYEVLTASGITGTFGAVTFTGVTPTQYSVSYLSTSVQVQISMTGVVMLSSNSVSFGNVAVGDSGSRSVTLTNSGPAPLTITSIGTAAPFSSTNDCGAVLASSASCTINLSFSPAAAGSASGTLTILSDAPGQPATVTLSGAGEQEVTKHRVTATVANGEGTISPADVMVTEGQTQTFTVTPAAGYSISSVSGCGGSLSGSTFTTAPISAACSITATFAVVVTAQGKGGGGSMNFLSLGGLLIVLFLRCLRPRLRSVVALLLALPCMTQAADFNRWYGGVRLGSARTDVSSADVNNRLNDLGYDVSARVEDSSRTAWGVVGGWRASQYFGAQLGYTNLGTVDTAFTGEALDIQAFLRDGSHVQPRSASGFDFNLLGRYPLGKRFEIVAQLGAFAWNADYTVSNSGGAFLKREDSGFDLTYGAGLEYGFDGGLAVTGGWTCYEIDRESIDFLGLGLQYRW